MRPTLESLEPRTLLFAWTPQEVYLAELINRARADPIAEGQRLGLNLATGLTIGEQALLTHSQPLALDPALTAAARAHSADMAARFFFDHVNPDGLSPTQRVQAAGYAGTAGENIGAGYTSIDALYRAWMAQPSERRNLLSLYTSFDATYHYDQIGPGLLLNAPGAAYPSYFTTDFGNPSQSVRTPWLLGVVFDDADHNGFYSIGEGLAGVRVDVFAGSNISGSPAASYTTDAAGDYQLPLTSGSYTIVFTRAADGYRSVTSAIVGSENVEVSARASDFAPPPPPPSPPTDPLGSPGLPANPVYFQGRPAVAFMNTSGRPIAALRDAQGHWAATDLQQSTGSPAVAGDLQLWVDSRDGFLYAAARSNSGVLVFKRDNAGAWSFRNLTAEIHVSRPIISNLTTFTDAAGLRQIAGLDASGHLVTYWMTGLLWPQGWRYYYTDVASRDLTLRGHAMPTVTGDVTSYTTRRNSLNVVATDDYGNVFLFFRPGGGLATQLWNWTNLTALTGAAAFAGSVTANETTARVVNISGVDASGNLWMITWRAGDGWRSTNVTAAVPSGSLLQSGSIGSWVNNGGVGFVAGLTPSGDVVLYRYQFTAGQTNWAFASVSAAIPDAPHLTGPLRVAFNAGAMLITGLTDTGEVTRFTFTPGQTWTAEDISSLI